MTYYLWCGDGESVCDVWNVPYLRPHRPCWIHTTPFLGPQCCRIQRNSCSSLEVKHSRHFPAAMTPASFDVHLLSFASCVGVTQPVLRLFFFSEEVLPYVAVHSVCSWEEVRSGFSSLTILGPFLCFECGSVSSSIPLEH